MHREECRNGKEEIKKQKGVQLAEPLFVMHYGFD